MTAVESTVGQLRGSNAADRNACAQFTRQLIDEILNSYCKGKGKQRWCEKTPINIDHLGFIETVFPDAAYVCLHRHGLDVMASMIRANYIPIAKMHFDRGGGDVIGAVMNHWCEYTERLLAFEKLHPSRSHRVRYEDLVADPDREIASMCDRLDLEPVADLGARAFTSKHDRGAGDSRIASTTQIEQRRIGHGLHLDVSRVPPMLRKRTLRLLEALGY
jgi:hypothetical protein